MLATIVNPMGDTYPSTPRGNNACCHCHLQMQCKSVHRLQIKNAYNIANPMGHTDLYTPWGHKLFAITANPMGDTNLSAPWVHTRHAMHVNRLGATVIANIL